MSESDTQNTRVNDRRRFDPEGNPREESPVQQPEVEAPEEASPEEISAQAAELDLLRTELEGSKKRIDELARGYQSLLQDREEFKARLSRERERMIDVEKGNVALTLIEAIDELDLCLNASAQDTSPLAVGVRLIRDNLLSKLAAVGVERFDPVGKPFDPNLAEAADMDVTADPAQDQLVIAEMRAGYRLKGRVIRPARVKVAKYIEPARA